MASKTVLEALKIKSLILMINCISVNDTSYKIGQHPQAVNSVNLFSRAKIRINKYVWCSLFSVNTYPLCADVNETFRTSPDGSNWTERDTSYRSDSGPSKGGVSE